MTHVQTRIFIRRIYKNIHHKRASYDGDKISDFNTSFYIPAIQRLAFHLPHVPILGTNHFGELQQTSFKPRELFQDVLCHCDYAERVVANFTDQIQYFLSFFFSPVLRDPI